MYSKYFLKDNILPLCVGLFVLCAIGNPLFAQGVPLNQELQEEETTWRLREKYSQIVGVEFDSLSQVPLYKMLDKWAVFVKQNPEKIDGHREGVFAQFIYYLVYNTKIPSNVPLIYSDEKVYLFRNTAFLGTGDLLFLGKEEAKPERVAIYLQNDKLVIPAEDGQLSFRSLKEMQQQYILTAAKVIKDEKEPKP